MKEGIKKNYETDEVIVHWDSGKCIHSARCALGLPAVFRPRERPWIVLSAATAAEIVAQVEKCPSGALTVTRKGTSSP